MLNEKDQINLEHVFLGSLFSQPAAIIDIWLDREDFVNEGHYALFERFRASYAENKRLIAHDFVTDPYGFENIISLAEMGMGSPESYAEQLIDQRRKRDFAAFTRDLQERMETQSASSVLGDIAVFLKENHADQGLKPVNKVRETTAKDLSMPVKCYPTGLRRLDLDCMLGGLYEGYTYGLCGAEKAGKTTLAHTISYNLNKSGCKHLYIAMEMGSKQIEQRNIARELGFNSARFLDSRDLVKRHMEKIDYASNNTVYLDAPGMRLEEILFNISMAQIKYGIKGFFVDYWQLVGGKPKSESEEKHLRDVAQGFADFARKQGLWCILLAQMNKDGGLFGGNGLRKACDQLYMIQDVKDYPKERWLRMDASRYTERNDLGSENGEGLRMNTEIGPFFEEVR